MVLLPLGPSSVVLARVRVVPVVVVALDPVPAPRSPYVCPPHSQLQVDRVPCVHDVRRPEQRLGSSHRLTQYLHHRDVTRDQRSLRQVVTHVPHPRPQAVGYPEPVDHELEGRAAGDS